MITSIFAGDDVLDRQCATRQLLCQQPASVICGHGGVPRSAEPAAATAVQAP